LPEGSGDTVIFARLREHPKTRCFKQRWLSGSALGGAGLAACIRRGSIASRRIRIFTALDTSVPILAASAQLVPMHATIKSSCNSTCDEGLHRSHASSRFLSSGPRWLPLTLPANLRHGEGSPALQINATSLIGRVSRVTPVQTALRNCSRDEGGPFEFGNQVLISSHRKLLWPWW
jgi:hypothetical protein